ncbi:hypothetical protein [Methylobacterium komagatae]
MADQSYPEGVTAMDHAKHDLRMGRFPNQSSVATFLKERATLAAQETVGHLPSGHSKSDASDLIQSDLRELLAILGLSDHARPQSPHEVFQHALSYLKGRLALSDEAFATLHDLYDAASEHAAFVPEKTMDRADRLFRWERSFREDWAQEGEE